MTTTQALIINTSNAPMVKGTIERRALGEKDVRVAIAYSGICHSDVHQARSEWGSDIFPMVPGHEIVGHVVEVGSAVTKFKVGQTVGVGVFVDSCRECDACKANLESYCEKGPVGSYNAYGYNGEVEYGGYSKEIVTDEHFVLHIADGVNLAECAPLLCAGITVYSPLRHWGAGPGKKVAILGMGGLGHLAVKFAVAMGAEVTVLGHSLGKKDDAISFGAADYRSTADKQTFKDLAKKFDFILNTTSADIPIDDLLGLIKLDGSLVFVGLPVESQTFNVFGVTAQRRSISGSQVGGQVEVQEMLDFAANHNIGATIELLDATDPAKIDEAWNRVVSSDIRYRFVIDASTI
ncbi:MAG: NAD(P)-dependent alcohol dehydrogenase [Micrococcales bacterium]